MMTRLNRDSKIVATPVLKLSSKRKMSTLTKKLLLIALTMTLKLIL